MKQKMKKIQIEYRLDGSLTVEVPDDFEVTGNNMEVLIRQQSDKDLVAGIEHDGFEIEGDAIDLISYREIEPGEDHDV